MKQVLLLILQSEKKDGRTADEAKSMPDAERKEDVAVPSWTNPQLVLAWFLRDRTNIDSELRETEAPGSTGPRTHLH
ncbi:hypothetical protein KIN20_033322 [Parelaphostrongylus tenuis]|uniref:Uncharacterized protein n=1 Tax=Parelaphostrongylus tenuis TaxID=148309 RepID=A0AAD5R8A6_PARTN|nr:hypothetical protein KIN20_033322 [Parelaphostrongylus tenuis]